VFIVKVVSQSPLDLSLLLPAASKHICTHTSANIIRLQTLDD